MTTTTGSSVIHHATLDMDDVAEGVCGLLNSKGGRILIEGIETGEMLAQGGDAAIAEVEEHLQATISPSGLWSCSVDDFDDRRVLTIDVSEGAEKPYVVDGTIWIARGNRIQRAVAADVYGLIRDRIRADERWERRIAFGIELDDLDLVEVRKTAREIERTERHAFRDRDDPVSILSELSLYSVGQVSNACVVLFAKEPARLFPQASVRLTVYSSTKRGSEYVFDQLLGGNLFETVREIERVLPAGVASAFGDEWQRLDRPAYPKQALREAVLNALIHRDLESPSGGTTIGVFPGRIEIRNAGSLPAGLSTTAALTKEHGSLPHNPDIAHVCFLRGWIEKVGRGTQLIAEQFKEAGLKPPKWKSDASWTTLTLRSRMDVLYGASAPKLNRRQQRILKGLNAGDQITVADYMEKLKEPVTSRTVRNDLASLVDLSLLERRGSGSNTHYVRTTVPRP